jgi:chromosomal replication initiator protein
MQQTAESVWKKCLSFVEDNIDTQAFKTWFNPIVPVKLKDNALNIEVPSKFFYEWIEEHYIKILKTALHKELGHDGRLVYIIRMENTYGSKLPYTQKSRVVVVQGFNLKTLRPQVRDKHRNSKTRLSSQESAT